MYDISFDMKKLFFSYCNKYLPAYLYANHDYILCYIWYIRGYIYNLRIEELIRIPSIKHEFVNQYVKYQLAHTVSIVMYAIAIDNDNMKHMNVCTYACMYVITIDN